MILATHPRELAQAAYGYLLHLGGTGRWQHVGSPESHLAQFGRDSSKLLGNSWKLVDAGSILEVDVTPTHLFIDGDSLTLDRFVESLQAAHAFADSSIICGTGSIKDQAYRDVLFNTLEDRISIISSVAWWVLPKLPPLPSAVRCAVLTPCFRDTWRLEQNLAWRPELVSGLDVHIFDDNFEPAEIERLSAIARECGWHYHRSGLGEHPDYTDPRAEFSAYSRFLWESFVSLADDYDIVIKVDTDACLLRPDWWHEAAARLQGKNAMMGTFEVRRAHEVADFWNVARRNGYSVSTPQYPMHLQGGIYAITGGALRLIRKMGFMDGPHFGFTEDGYMSFCAQLLGIEMVPAATFGSRTRHKCPPMRCLTHLKAIHPLMRREWPPKISAAA